MNQLLKYNNKQARARVIAKFVREAGYPGVVCFTCGNAAEALRGQGLDVIEVGPRGGLTTNHWFTPASIKKIFPQLLDATSGHLSLALMWEIAMEIKREHEGGGVWLMASVYDVPSGSGETITCLRLAYPEINFFPVYGCGQGTEYHAEAPLNGIVRAMGGQGAGVTLPGAPEKPEIGTTAIIGASCSTGGHPVTPETA